jgi:hypothetical protein
MVLDTLHMPLVNNNNDFLAFGIVDFFKKLLVLLVNTDSLPLGEESRHSLNIPVDEVLVHALFGESGTAD